MTLRLKDGLLPKPSWVKMGQVRTLASDRIGRRLAAVDPETLDQVVAGLDEIIGR